MSSQQASPRSHTSTSPRPFSNAFPGRWREVRRQATSVPSDARLQPVKHENKPITWLGSVVIVLSIPVVGPLQVPPPVGGGEAHAAGPGAPTCVDREVAPPTSFSPLQHQGVSPIQHPSLSFPTSLSHSFSSLPFLGRKVFPKKKKISGEVHRDKTAKRSLVSSRRTH